jgi:chromosome condensin MukBEF ATPase and DNA-binding subunit MukB
MTDLHGEMTDLNQPTIEQLCSDFLEPKRASELAMQIKELIDKSQKKIVEMFNAECKMRGEAEEKLLELTTVYNLQCEEIAIFKNDEANLKDQIKDLKQKWTASQKAYDALLVSHDQLGKKLSANNTETDSVDVFIESETPGEIRVKILRKGNVDGE